MWYKSIVLGKIYLTTIFNHNGGEVVNLLASTAIGHGFELGRVLAKDYTIGIGCFPIKDAALMSRNKFWFARNQDNVSEWSDMLTSALLI
jgi:hypothetical protein